MTYQEAIRYLDTFVNYERDASLFKSYAFKLERMKEFLSCIGNPQEALKVIHVAGTKGKGSTSSFIAQILKEEGYRVGLYTSPHLQDLRERIRVLDHRRAMRDEDIVEGMISESELAALMEELFPKIEAFCSKRDEFSCLSYFEILTALAIRYFKDNEVDFAVFETGLGGRLDATNAAQALVSVITPISLDHEHVLGHTLAEIAFEKAGIIKSENHRTDKGLCVALTAFQRREARSILKHRAQETGTVLFESGKDFFIKKLRKNLLEQNFFYKGLSNKTLFLKTKMLGGHQLANASLALASCEALRLYNIDIKKESMEKGVLNTFWPGRLEIFKASPILILDGAHNEESVFHLSVFLKQEFKNYRKWLLFGASCDKDIKTMASQLESLFDEVVLTRVDHGRAADPKKMIRPCFRRESVHVTLALEEAIHLLKTQAKSDDVVVVTGSLFLVGGVRQKW